MASLSSFIPTLEYWPTIVFKSIQHSKSSFKISSQFQNIDKISESKLASLTLVKPPSDVRALVALVRMRWGGDCQSVAIHRLTMVLGTRACKWEPDLGSLLLLHNNPRLPARHTAWWMICKLSLQMFILNVTLCYSGQIGPLKSRGILYFLGNFSPFALVSENKRYLYFSSCRTKYYVHQAPWAYDKTPSEILWGNKEMNT